MASRVLAIIIAIVLGGAHNFITNIITSSPVEIVTSLKKPNDDPRPIRGTIRKPSFEALPGATVDLYTAGNVFVASTGSNMVGWYEFNPVPPGSYELRVSADHYRDTTVSVTVSNIPVMQDITMQEE